MDEGNSIFHSLRHGPEASDEVIQSLLTVIEKGDEKPATWLALGWRYHNIGNAETAIAAFRQAIMRDPTSPTAFHGLGCAQRQLGLRKEAAKAFGEALIRDPGHLAALTHLAELSTVDGATEKAWQYVQCALAASPHHIPALLLRARLSFRAADVEAAEADLLDVVRLVPNHPRAVDELAFLRRYGRLTSSQTVSLCLLRPIEENDLHWYERCGLINEALVISGGATTIAHRSWTREVIGDWRAAIAAGNSTWLLIVKTVLPGEDSLKAMLGCCAPGIGLVVDPDRSIYLVRADIAKAWLRIIPNEMGWDGAIEALAGRLRCRVTSHETVSARLPAADPGHPRRTVWLVTPYGRRLFGGGETFLRSLVTLHKSMGHVPTLVGVGEMADLSGVDDQTEDLAYLHLPRSIDAIRVAALQHRPTFIHVLSGLGYEFGEALEGLDVGLIYGTHFWRDMFDGVGAFENIDRIGRPRIEFASLCAVASQSYANSAYTRDVIERHFDISLPVLNPLPVEVPRERLTLGHGTCALLLNGRADKGATLVLDVARLLPDIRFRIVAAQSSQSELERNVRSQRLVNVEILPTTDDVDGLYRDARVVLVPSYAFIETFSRVILEAQRYGVPVLGSDRGNVPRLLSRSGTVLPDEPAAWASELRRLFADPAYHSRQALRSWRNSRKYPFALLVQKLGRLHRAAERSIAVAVGSGIGNLIQCTPAIRFLSEKLARPVDVVLNADFPGCGSLFSDSPWTGCVLPLPAAMYRTFDTMFIFDCFGSLLPQFSAERAIVLGTGNLPSDKHEAEHNLKNLSAQLGISYEASDVGRYFVGGYSRGVPAARRIGLHAGSKDGIWTAKRWPYFVELAHALRSQGYEIVSLGNEGEYVPGTDNLTGVSLRKTIETIRSCKYFIANDSGLMHVADALGVPLTAIFGPTSLTKNRPLSPESRIISLNKPCSPCQFNLSAFRTCRCIAEISSKRVLDAVIEHLGALVT